MSKTLEFKVFCFEAYRADKKLTGKDMVFLTTLKNFLMFCIQRAEITL